MPPMSPPLATAAGDGAASLAARAGAIVSDPLHAIAIKSRDSLPPIARAEMPLGDVRFDVRVCCSPMVSLRLDS